MNKRWLIGVCIIVFLSGCNLFQQDIEDMDPKDLPDVPAFQDDFTREFMASTDEISDGYYLFESKTGGYTLPFPEDAQIDQIHYEKVKDHYEGIRIVGERDRTTGELYKAYVTYENPSISKEADIQLSLVKDAVGYEGEFEKKEHDAIIHYFARDKYVVSNKKSSVYHFIGLVQSNDSNQLIRYRYNVRCPDEEKGCDYDLGAIEKEVEKVLTSVEFKE